MSTESSTPSSLVAQMEQDKEEYEMISSEPKPPQPLPLQTVANNESKIVETNEPKIITNSECKNIINDETGTVTNSECKMVENNETKTVTNSECKPLQPAVTNVKDNGKDETTLFRKSLHDECLADQVNALAKKIHDLCDELDVAVVLVTMEKRDLDAFRKRYKNEPGFEKAKEFWDWTNPPPSKTSSAVPASSTQPSSSRGSMAPFDVVSLMDCLATVITFAAIFVLFVGLCAGLSALVGTTKSKAPDLPEYRTLQANADRVAKEYDNCVFLINPMQDSLAKCNNLLEECKLGLDEDLWILDQLRECNTDIRMLKAEHTQPCTLTRWFNDTLHDDIRGTIKGTLAFHWQSFTNTVTQTCQTIRQRIITHPGDTARHLEMFVFLILLLAMIIQPLPEKGVPVRLKDMMVVVIASFFMGLVSMNWASTRHVLEVFGLMISHLVADICIPYSKGDPVRIRDIVVGLFVVVFTVTVGVQYIPSKM